VLINAHEVNIIGTFHKNHLNISGVSFQNAFANSFASASFETLSTALAHMYFTLKDSKICFTSNDILDRFQFILSKPSFLFVVTICSKSLILFL